MFTRSLLLALVAAGVAACSRGEAEDPQREEREFWSDRRNTELHEAYVLANVKFILLHEMAHSIFDDYKVSVGGRPEDAADRVATWLMTPRRPGGRPEDEYAAGPMASDLARVVYFWMNLGRGSSVQDRKAMPWFDEHGISEQRGFQVLCLIYGNNPERYTRLADEYALPEHRRESCIREAEDNDRAWRDLIGRHHASPEEKQRNRDALTNQDRLVRSQPPGVFYAEHQPTELFMKLPWFTWNSRAFAQSHTTLEGVVNELLSLRQPPGKGIPLVMATSCDGIGNAFYDPDERSITLCYPLVDGISWSGRKLLWDNERKRRAAEQNPAK